MNNIIKIKNIININEMFIQILFNILKKYIFKIIKNENGSQFIYINDDFLVFINVYLKKNLFSSFDILSNMTAVDCIQKKYRFEVYYLYLNITSSYRLFLVIQKQVTLYNPYSFGINSLYKIYKSALQLEREIQDMYGIYFINHKDLRRILTDYGFRGFPLRKDFPLTGFYELKYDEIQNIIIINELKLVQNFRIFDFINPQ